MHIMSRSFQSTGIACVVDPVLDPTRPETAARL